jgi:hypothetical protein
VSAHAWRRSPVSQLHTRRQAARFIDEDAVAAMRDREEAAAAAQAQQDKLDRLGLLGVNEIFLPSKNLSAEDQRLALGLQSIKSLSAWFCQDLDQEVETLTGGSRHVRHWSRSLQTSTSQHEAHHRVRSRPNRRSARSVTSSTQGSGSHSWWIWSCRRPTRAEASSQWLLMISKVAWRNAHNGREAH